MAERPDDDENFEYQLAAVSARSGKEPVACQKRAAWLISHAERSIMRDVWAHVNHTPRPALGPMTHNFYVNLFTPLSAAECPIVGAYILKEVQPALPHPLPGFTWSAGVVFVDRELHGSFRVTACEIPIAPEEQKR